MPVSTPEAYQLMHEGTLALAQVEHNGIRVDLDRFKESMDAVEQEIKVLKDDLRDDPVWDIWRQRFGRDANMGSHDQLGVVLFDELKFPVTKRTKTNRASTDESVLSEIRHPFVQKFLEKEKLTKLHSTYMQGILSEVEGEYLHPSFSLNFTRTFRSCIAKGTYIEVVRDVKRYPKGIKIENLKAGNYVYCYDDAGKLRLKRIIWTGKTGRKKVVRIHWSARGKKGFLDVTPEHRIRLADGQYVEARRLMELGRPDNAPKNGPTIHAMALGRCRDRLFVTGNPNSLHDHRLIYSELIGPLKKTDVVHHIDKNHLNNNVWNLLRLSNNQQHCKLFHHDTFTEVHRKKAYQSRIKNLRDGITIPKTGEDHPQWIHFSKYQFLRLLAKNGGRLTKSSHDFETLKRKARLLGIDLKQVKSRYGEYAYLSKGRLQRTIESVGIAQAQRVLGVSYYKLKTNCKRCGIPFERRWANQVGPFIPNNHHILDVEWINKTTDVYDIEVEDCHNFIANEICVHNSSHDPNFQNIPVRNKRVSKYIRSCFIPREGRSLIEVDYGQIEVRVSACLHQDPTMLRYIEENYDMHFDMAKELFLLKDVEVSKEARHAAKNGFVFASFYGDYYKSIAANLWSMIGRNDIKTTNGVDLYTHLKEYGIEERGSCFADDETIPGTFEEHLQKVEERFWTERFPVYNQWRYDWWDSYAETGGFWTPTGFYIHGILKRNQVINAPVQAGAFHCLLWSLIQLVGKLKQHGFKTLIVGQIHDSMLLDVPEDELEDLLPILRYVMTVSIRKHWPWIITPLEIDATISRDNWFDKEAITI